MHNLFYRYCIPHKSVLLKSQAFTHVHLFLTTLPTTHLWTIYHQTWGILDVEYKLCYLIGFHVLFSVVLWSTLYYNYCAHLSVVEELYCPSGVKILIISLFLKQIFFLCVMKFSLNCLFPKEVKCYQSRIDNIWRVSS